MSNQQEQALHYFDRTATAWNAKAENPYSIIADRNRTALSVLQSINGKSLIDLGCGSGQLVVDAANHGVRAVGVDFAPEMIALANKNASGMQNATFHVASIFDLPANIGKFEVVAAMGLIEYLPLDKLCDFFQSARRLLGQGGRLALGSRNRLFNLVTFNDYTAIESAENTCFLFKEAITLHRASTQEEAIAALGYGCTMTHPDRHPSTGIEVEARYQFTPADLIARSIELFRARKVFPVHFHGLPPILKTENQPLHDGIAKMIMATRGDDHRLLPWCSSFVIELEAV